MAAFRDVPCWPPSLRMPSFKRRSWSSYFTNMNGTDLPCADCGTELVERTITANELPTAIADDGSVRVAKCPNCGARYYPKQTLSKLSERRTDPSAR